MRKPKVSVVMPVYNAEKYLNEAIESILNQSFSDFELIFVNDGSSDRTLKIINSYKDKRIKVLDNKKNLGLVPSLNKGLIKARGEYIARCDGDDISDLSRFKKQVNFLDKNKEFVLVGSNLELIDKNSKKIGQVFCAKDDEIIRRKIILRCNDVMHPAVMFRKKTILKTGFYRNFFNKGAEEYDLWFRMLGEGKFYNIQEKLVKRRFYKNAYSMKHHLRVEIFALFARVVNLLNYIKFNILVP